MDAFRAKSEQSKTSQDNLVWRIGWISKQPVSQWWSDNQWLSSDSIIIERVITWDESVTHQNVTNLNNLLRQAKELSEEIDVLILGEGIEKAAELVEENVHVPIICASSAPLIIRHIFGAYLDFIKKGEQSTPSSAHEIVLAARLVAELAAKYMYWHRHYLMT